MRSYSDLISIPPTFPRKSVILVVILNLGLFWILISYAWNSFRDMDSSRKCLRLAELSGIIDNLDEVLTMSVRMAAVTGDKAWEDRYRNFEPKLNCAIKEALEVGKELRMSGAAAKTDAASIKLVSMENRAFELIHEGRSKAATELLSGLEYESEKNIYRRGMEQITDQMNEFISLNHGEGYFKNCMMVAFVLLAVPSLIISLIVIFIMINRYESELGKRDRRFRDMGEIAGEWIWELDSKMRFTYANRKIKEITGYAPEEVVGKTPVELMPSSKAVEIRLYMDVLINSPKPFLDLEHTILHRDGTCRIMKVNGIPLYGHNNEFIGYRGVCSDMP